MIETAAPQPGTLLVDRYEILRPLGQGGMATTFAVRDRLYGANLALKLVSVASPEVLSALRAEFQLLRSLCHPCLCQVHDFGLVPAVPSTANASRSTCFYTAELIEGPDLGDYRQSAPWSRVLSAFGDALEGLAVLHAHGVRHGDFKPANVMVSAEGRGVLIDLGCARRLDAPNPSSISGTRRFLAPELLEGLAADQRADLFAAGVTLADLIDASRTRVPQQIRSLASRLASPSPSARPGDVAEVLELLGRPAPAPHTIASSRSGIAGRAHELDVIHRALSTLHTQQPGPRVLHFAGEEGSGRSRLLRELKWLAQQHLRVVESNTAAPDALCDMLGTLLSRPVPLTLAGVIDARDLLARGAPPVVCLIDDAHLLADGQLDLLRVLARTTQRTDPVLYAIASEPGLSLSGDCVARLPVEPLAREAVQSWLAGVLSDKAIARAVELTGGTPGAIASLLAQLAAGEVSPDDLELARIRADSRTTAAWGRLSADRKRVMGLLALAGLPLNASDLQILEVEPSSLPPLVAQGWIRREGLAYVSARPGLRASLLESASQSSLSRWHGALADLLGKRIEQQDERASLRADLVARRVSHLALAGRHAQARDELLRNQPLHGTAPRAWARAADDVAAGTNDPELGLIAARLALAAGLTRQGLHGLEALAAVTLPDHLHAPVELELGTARLKSGDAQSATTHARAALQSSSDPEVRGRGVCLLVRSLLQQDAYREVADTCADALSWCEDTVLRADLLESGALASSSLGRPSEAEQRIAEALSLLQSVDDPRRLVRAHGTSAFVAYQSGDLGHALRAYGAALDLAERHELSDQIATAALNLGTARHQQGDLAGALGCYERGLRIATALGQRATEALLLFNIAKLHFDAGLFDRADTGADRCEVIARASSLVSVQAAVDSLRGENELARGKVVRAREALARARESFASNGSVREQAEVELQLAETAIAAGDPREAAEWLERCAAEIGRSGAGDLPARLGLVRARWLRAASRSADATPVLESALERAKSAGQSDLEAEIELELSRVWRARSSERLAKMHRERAAALWERTAASLPGPMRESFWRHPRRSEAAEQAPVAAGEAPLRERKLEMLLDINKRLNAASHAGEILQRAMDAAIDLTGAERGFVLLSRSPGSRAGLEVAVGRNLDKEKLERSHLKFSRGIAEQVIATGEPMVTSNAQSDSRFSTESSVHAMHLQSVVCVPVIAGGEILGALYLDNRFQRGRFSDDDVRVLLAFSDQVAIALTHARLQEELRRRNEELEQERARIEELLRGREAELERLHEQVRNRSHTAHRFDYQAIIGSCASMQKLFALLDRVIDSELTVLVQGESGTGKELVARAIHGNSPRAAGPLISINCAALPESLLESELFGYERGAFTGADQSRRGLLVEAAGGVLFLDEIGEMPLAMQVKLLRVLQEREVRPLGSRKSLPVDFRLVCATNRTLRDEVSRGRFREDLFYRVSAVEVSIPPLRQRAEDIPELVAHFLARAAGPAHRPIPEISRQAMRKLSAFEWPGNVRQLENVVTKAVVLCDQNRIVAGDIDLPRSQPTKAEATGRTGYLERERLRVTEALEANRWNVRKAAESLGIPRPTFYRKLRAWGMTPKA